METAFPVPGDNRYDGMSLRDYFAARAMQSIIANPPHGDRFDVAARAYGFADAMLEVRAT